MDLSPTPTLGHGQKLAHAPNVELFAGLNQYQYEYEYRLANNSREFRLFDIELSATAKTMITGKPGII
jgi:hypothetical protein